MYMPPPEVPPDELAGEEDRPSLIKRLWNISGIEESLEGPAELQRRLDAACTPGKCKGPVQSPWKAVASRVRPEPQPPAAQFQAAMTEAAKGQLDAINQALERAADSVESASSATAGAAAGVGQKLFDLAPTGTATSQQALLKLQSILRFLQSHLTGNLKAKAHAAGVQTPVAALLDRIAPNRWRGTKPSAAETAYKGATKAGKSALHVFQAASGAAWDTYTTAMVKANAAYEAAMRQTKQAYEASIATARHQAPKAYEAAAVKGLQEAANAIDAATHAYESAQAHAQRALQESLLKSAQLYDAATAKAHDIYDTAAQKAHDVYDATAPAAREAVDVSAANVKAAFESTADKTAQGYEAASAQADRASKAAASVLQQAADIAMNKGHQAYEAAAHRAPEMYQAFSEKAQAAEDAAAAAARAAAATSSMASEAAAAQAQKAYEEAARQAAVAYEAAGGQAKAAGQALSRGAQQTVGTTGIFD